jgi:adenylate kinase
MNLILFGAPGAGKGTIGELLEEKFNILSFSTGQLLREREKKEDEFALKLKQIMEKGMLVSDDIINHIILEKIKDKTGYILDGYPRTVSQAEFLIKNNIQIHHVIYLKISEDEIINRITNRRVCPKCGEIYHIITKKPQKKGFCDHDNEKLILREDDTKETVKKRYQTYLLKTLPVLDRLKKEFKIIEVNADNSINDVYEEVLSKLHI